MAELHSALQALGPTDWSSVPAAEQDLDIYLADLFAQSQLILDSIPIPPPDEATARPRSKTTSSTASNASEISLSSARSDLPPPEHEKLQKEWGKPIKLKQTENPLGMSVYKLSAKDGRGAWFARRSVHEGLGFTKFKKSLELEFPESLAVQGAPGEGNVRGIGGEEKVADIKVPNRGRVEVYRLSAQFPGPTTPRDFVTLLTTSSDAMKDEKLGHDGAPKDLTPRHYMVISKPCNHPDAQPRQGFIRGSYESVEFIREVPMRGTAAPSSADLNSPNHNQYDSEENPVEWIMITRSDPGGSVPRFMVERGTPSSIVADASKFLNWACQNDFDEGKKVDDKSGSAHKPSPKRQESYQSWRGRGLVGIEEQEKAEHEGVSQPQVQPQVPAAHDSGTATTPDTNSSGVWGTVAGVAASLKPYTPQVVLDRLPQNETVTPTTLPSTPGQDTNVLLSKNALTNDGADAASIISETSFASADSHLTSSEEDDASMMSKASPSGTTKTKHLSHHEKELQKLNDRKAQLAEKFANTQSKLDQDKAKQSTKEESALQKANEKHEKEMKKHEEKYQKELRKLNERQEKERKKVEQKKRKQEDKDEKSRLIRERDEARKELDVIKKESDTLRDLVAELQKENTSMVMKLGRLGMGAGEEADSPSGGVRSRSSSIQRLMKSTEKDASSMAGVSLKSSGSG